jgi:hypothetical protein
MGRRPALTKKNIAFAYQLYQDGHNYRVIGEILGVSRTTIENVLKGKIVPRRTGRPSRKQNKYRIMTNKEFDMYMDELERKQVGTV